MLNIRQSPAGYPAGFFDSPQPAQGDVLQYDTATRQWVIGTLPDTAAFDFIIRDRQDLVDVVAPVAGNFNLPSGSYAFVDPIALPADERLSIGAGQNVRLWGGNQVGSILTGLSSTAALLTIGSGSIVDIDGLTMVNNAAQAVILSGGTATARNLRATNNAGQSALTVSGASFRADQSVYTSNTNYAVQQSGGTLELTNSRVQSTAANAVAISTAGAIEHRAIGCEFVGALDCYQLSGATNARTYLTDCHFTFAGPARAGINANNTLFLSVRGGSITASAVGGNGILIAGNLNQLLVDSIQIRGTGGGVNRTGGSVGSAQLTNLLIDASVGTGITWAAASIPASGLSIVGGSILSAIPLSGFTAADARVNLKGVVGAVGLLQETAIVP